MDVSRSRVLTLWCPDWPVVAAVRESQEAGSAAGSAVVAPVSAPVPVAVLHSGRVAVCNAPARAAGVRRGMRRRDVESRCLGMTTFPADADRDARAFEPVAAAVEEHAPGIEVLRPGLVVCAARGPAGYYGSESAAAEQIIDAVEALGVECRVGLADGVSVAVLAARRSLLVPPGTNAQFCAKLPLPELARDPAVAPPEWGALVDLLRRLGVVTAGELAAFPAATAAARFGASGAAMHRLASGAVGRGLYRRRHETEIAVTHQCDPPLERVDTAAFAARSLADRFHRLLAARGLACMLLDVSVVTDRAQELNRVWRCVKPLTATDTADRLRWQLDGWLTRGSIGAVTELRLAAVEAVDAGQIVTGLWGSAGQEESRADSAFARVQGILGPESVMAAARSGGRSPHDRITAAAWGEQHSPERDPTAPWPGALPVPAPARAATASYPVRASYPIRETHSGGWPSGVAVIDDHGAPVGMTERGMLSGLPAAVDGRRVLSWAGPWPVDERWWAGRGASGTTTATPRARLQVVVDASPPMLLALGPTGWWLEAVYD